MASSVTCDMMREAMKVLEANLDLPAGYYIKLDTATDNILVLNQRLGFCLTGRYVKDHPNQTYLPAVQKNLEHLKRVTNDPELVPCLLRTEDMERQGRQVTRFD
jgi:hypothetical protein